MKEEKYYNAKGYKDDDINKAIEEFLVITRSGKDDESIEWVFKSYKQLIKINFHRQNYEQSISFLKDLIEIIPKVNPTYAKESLNRMINAYTVSGRDSFVSQLYDIILDSIKRHDIFDEFSASGQKLWLKININKLNSNLENKEFDECPDLISSINKKLEQVTDSYKLIYTLDLIAAEIEYYSSKVEVDLKKLNELYRRSLNVSSAVTHPRTTGIIRECGGKVNFYRGDYEKARIDFYESFKSFDEAGSLEKKRILKYLALCSILTESEVNPFEAQETQSYSQLPEYETLITLIKCYDEMNIDSFDEIINKLHTEKDPLLKDNIFREASRVMQKNLRCKILIHISKSFKAIKFDYLTRLLKINEDELEDLVIKLTTKGKLSGIKIDFINRFILCDHQKSNIFSTRLESRAIFYNIEAMDALNLDMFVEKPEVTEDLMELDDEKSLCNSLLGQDRYSSLNLSGSNLESLLDKILFLTEKPTKDIEWFKLLDSWRLCIENSIPTLVKHELSQKDQIFSEQKAGNGKSNMDLTDENEIGQNNSEPITNSQKQPTDLQESDDEDSVDRCDLLRNWCKELGYLV